MGARWCARGVAGQALVGRWTPYPSEGEEAGADRRPKGVAAAGVEAGVGSARVRGVAAAVRGCWRSGAEVGPMRRMAGRSESAFGPPKWVLV
jgi:hypothetical protein